MGKMLEKEHPYFVDSAKPKPKREVFGILCKLGREV